jgi:hypothetical protein
MANIGSEKGRAEQDISGGEHSFAGRRISPLISTEVEARSTIRRGGGWFKTKYL